MAYTGGNAGYVRRLGKVPGSAAPTSPVAGYSTWFRGDTNVYVSYPTLAVDGDTVTEWRPKGGTYSPITLINHNPGSPITYKTGANGINGQPCLRSNAAVSVLKNFYTDNAIFEGGIIEAAQGTMFIVMRLNAGTTNFPAIVFEDSGFGRVNSYFNGGTLNVVINDGSSKTATKSGLASGVLPWIVTFHHESGTLYAGANDTRTASMGSIAAGSIVATAGNLRLQQTSGEADDIAEFIAYKTALSEANRKLVEQYLANRYGVTLPY